MLESIDVAQEASSFTVIQREIYSLRQHTLQKQYEMIRLLNPRTIINQSFLLA